MDVKYAFRMTHISNIPHILAVGITSSQSANANPRYVPIGDSSVIGYRANMPFAGRKLGDYIPFYFGPRSPMLYVVQHGYNGVTPIDPAEIVYCVLSLSSIFESGLQCIFTDGHALNRMSKIYSGELLPKIGEIVSGEDVYDKYWNTEEDLDLRRRKDAEILFEEDIPFALIAGFVVYNKEARQKLLEFGIKSSLIAIRPDYYY